MLTVLLTRPLEDSKELVHGLETLGCQVLSLPCISVGPALLPRDLSDCQRRLESADWLILTSPKALSALISVYGEATVRAWAKGLLVAAVGSQTALSAQNYGFRVGFVPDQACAQALADGLLTLWEHQSNQIAFWPCGQLADRAWLEIFEATAHVIDPCVVYETHVGPDLTQWPKVERMLSQGQVDVVVFASPSAVFGFARGWGDNPLPQNLRLVSIGPKTTQAVVATWGISPLEASEFSQQGLVRVIETLA